MAFVYGLEGAPATPYACHATPNTEDPVLVLRQATRGVDLYSLSVRGRGASLTAISGIDFRVRRWTTAGSGGDALTPAPRRIGTTAATSVVHKNGTGITPGTVSGAYQLGFGSGAAGPGGWVAPNPDAMIHVEGGSSDELDVNSVSGVASLLFTISGEIWE